MSCVSRMSKRALGCQNDGGKPLFDFHRCEKAKRESASRSCLRLFGALKLFRSKGGSAWFTQIWRLVLWQFLQLTAHECPKNQCSDRIALRELQLIPHLLSSEFWLGASSTSGLPSPLRPGGGLYVSGEMTQPNGTMKFHNCSSWGDGVEPQGSGWSFWGLRCKIH